MCALQLSVVRPHIESWTRSHKLSNLIEVHRTRRYRKYDPFIFPNTASQVYFMSHADRSRDRANWLVVIPTKSRVRVDKQYTLPIAYQQTDLTTLVEPVNDVISTSLVDESAPPEEVNNNMGFSFIQVNDDIDEAEEDDGDKESGWDDENETGEEQRDLYLYDDDENDDDEIDNEVGGGEDDVDN